MNNLHRETIRLNWVFLSENLETAELLDHMLGEFVITHDMYEEVKAERTKKEKISHFLFILQRRGPQAFDKFLDALVATNQAFISEQLTQTHNQLIANNQAMQV